MDQRYPSSGQPASHNGPSAVSVRRTDNLRALTVMIGTPVPRTESAFKARPAAGRSSAEAFTFCTRLGELMSISPGVLGRAGPPRDRECA